MNEIEMRFAPGGAIRAMPGRRLEVLAVPFGSPTDLDAYGTYFSRRTDFMMEPGDRRPTLYFHGFTPNKKMTEKPSPLGRATYSRIDDEGLWMEVELRATPMADRVWAAAEKGTCRASTGAVNYLTRNEGAEVTIWPIGELSLLDEGLDRHPANRKAIAMPLRALFEAVHLQVPQAFEAGEDKDDGDQCEPEGKSNRRTTMEAEIQKAIDDALAARDKKEADDKAARETMRKSIIDELGTDPKYRARFSVRKETTDTAKLPPEKQESHEFFWNLRHGGTPAMRVLEETEAAEGLPMVPQDALAQIVELRGAADLATRLGLVTYQTDKLIFNIPREATAMGALAAIAEEGAYVANEPAFALLPITVVKYGSMITATEELLEDQDLFQSWFTRAVARAWALARNTALYALLDTVGMSTVGVHSATLTDAEIMTWYFTMTDEWREGAKIIMNTGTMAAMRALLVATPRAYGDFPFYGGGPYPTFMGLPVFTNAAWDTLPSANNLRTGLSMLNPSIAGFVENKGLSIKVDPYGDSLNGRVRYFPRARFAPFVAQAAGHVVYEGHA